MHKENINYKTAHYLGKKKQLILRFNSVSVRDKIWSAWNKLRESRFFMSKDLPAHIKQEHN